MPDIPGPSELATRYFELLADEGFRPHYDEDGDVSFKYQGKSFHIHISEDDPSYFHLSGGLFPIEDDAALTCALRIANELNSRRKYVKFAVVQGEHGSWVGADVQMPVKSPRDVEPFLERVVSWLHNALEIFWGKMSDEMEAEVDDDGTGDFIDVENREAGAGGEQVNENVATEAQNEGGDLTGQIDEPSRKGRRARGRSSSRSRKRKQAEPRSEKGTACINARSWEVRYAVPFLVTR